MYQAFDLRLHFFSFQGSWRQETQAILSLEKSKGTKHRHGLSHQRTWLPRVACLQTFSSCETTLLWPQSFVERLIATTTISFFDFYVGHDVALVIVITSHIVSVLVEMGGVNFSLTVTCVHHLKYTCSLSKNVKYCHCFCLLQRN